MKDISNAENLLCKYKNLKLSRDFLENSKLINSFFLLAELLQSVEQGEPTTLVQALLTELSSRVQLNLGPTLASQLLGTSSTSGMDLINKVLVDPQIMWQRPFFSELRRLPPD